MTARQSEKKRRRKMVVTSLRKTYIKMSARCLSGSVCLLAFLFPRRSPINRCRVALWFVVFRMKLNEYMQREERNERLCFYVEDRGWQK